MDDEPLVQGLVFFVAAEVFGADDPWAAGAAETIT